MDTPYCTRLVYCLFLALAALNCASGKIALPVSGLENAEAFVAKAEGFSANAQYDGANFFLGKAAEIYRSEKR